MTFESVSMCQRTKRGTHFKYVAQKKKKKKKENEITKKRLNCRKRERTRHEMNETYQEILVNSKTKKEQT